MQPNAAASRPQYSLAGVNATELMENYYAADCTFPPMERQDAARARKVKDWFEAMATEIELKQLKTAADTGLSRKILALIEPHVTARLAKLYVDAGLTIPKKWEGLEDPMVKPKVLLSTVIGSTTDEKALLKFIPRDISAGSFHSFRAEREKRAIEAVAAGRSSKTSKTNRPSTSALRRRLSGPAAMPAASAVGAGPPPPPPGGPPPMR